MAGVDATASLPVRTETNGDVVAQLVDGTTLTQKLGIDASGRITMKLDDGNGNVITSQANGGQRALDVGINVAGVQVDPRAIRALTSADIVTADQGAPNTTANAWPTKITDGTNTAAVKAASIAAVATDPSLVVAFSPNSPLPAGTALIGSVNQGTSPWITKDQADGPVTPGAAAGFSGLVGGQFNTVLPTLTTGQQAALQTDASGRLLIGSIASPLPAGTNTLGNANAYQAGAPNTNTNPFFVSITNSTPGTPVNFYNATAAIASGASATSTYTITATKALSVKKVTMSSTAKMRHDFEISTNGTTFIPVFTVFTTAADPTFAYDFDELADTVAGTGALVHVISTNQDSLLITASAYVSINGVEN